MLRCHSTLLVVLWAIAACSAREESRAAIGEDGLARAEILRELSAPEGRSEEGLLELVRTAAERW